MLNAGTFKSVSPPTTGQQWYSQAPATPAAPSQPWGGGMLAPPGGYNVQPNIPVTPQQQGLAFASGLNGPTMAALQQQMGQYEGQLGMTQAGYNQAVGAANQDAAAQLARVNLGPEYDTVKRGTIYRQMEGLNAADRLAFQALGNQFEGFDLRKLQSWQGAGRAQWDNRSQGTAKGAVGSVGYNKRMTNIQQDLANQLTGIGIDKDSAIYAAQQGAADRKEAKAQLDDQNKTLDIKAKEYGIDKQQIQANLAQGLAKLGIDNMASVNQILDMMSSNDIQQRALGEQIFRQGMEYGGVFETLPQNTGTPPNAGVGGASGNNPVAGVAVDEFVGRGATSHG